MLGYLRRNKNLSIGLVLLLIIVLFAVLGRIFWDTSLADPLSGRANQEPSWDHPLGTDRQARDLLAVMIVGTPKTLYVGLAAGVIGVTIGTIFGLLAAYFGGWIDTVIRGVVDIGLTIPAILVLVLVAISLHAALTINQMAIVIGSFAWLFPTRTIRSQVLSIRERSYVQMARMSGANAAQVIFKEIMPNLLPYLAATFVGTVSGGLLASVGLDLLGLSELDSNTLGVTLYWANFYAALLHGLWWWFLPPVIIIMLVFVGLYLVSSGLDEFANPRTRRAV
jgi:peptide/nickel transport system permease protein